MEFCDRCRSLMYPAAGKLVCRRCGFTRDACGEQVVRSNSQPQNERSIAVHEKAEPAGLPTTRAPCPECGNGTAYWWLRQLRSADESEVRFFRCTRCGKTWREYN